MGFDNPELEIRLQQARMACETNADRMRDACNNVRITKRRAKVANHEICGASCACKSLQSGKVVENGTHSEIPTDTRKSST